MTNLAELLRRRGAHAQRHAAIGELLIRVAAAGGTPLSPQLADGVLRAIREEYETPLLAIFGEETQ